MSAAEQQILFNRFREKLNKSYHLVSHMVLELITEQGLSSIDLEDCTDSKCVRSVLSFVKNLRQQFNTNELFLFQLVRSKTEVQLSLKLSSLSQPEVTKEIVTQTCQQCNLEKLKLQVDIIVERMLDKIAGEDIAPRKEAVASEKVAPLREEIALPEEAENQKQAKSPELYEDKTPEAPVKEAPVKETPVQDPYVVERNSYNRQISKLLIDVTYALQIFRTGMFVQLEVSIDPSGTVVNHKVIKSSGSHDFDDTAIMSLEEIQFAPLPEAMLKYGNYVVILQIQNSR
ncbi:MAG: TonB family protein [SAR324 cluster bacterium]|nr:TonB family protein [SAR324 cluster bacterium]MDP7437834.1 TonB family protein [SAR324 cluster bacterium]